MAIYITGDLHGSVLDPRLYNPVFTKDDYLIITGDCGLMFEWSMGGRARDIAFRNQKYMSVKLNCTVLFVDGNHENFDYLDSLPVYDWNGGKVSYLKDNIIHLKRGQIFELEDKTFFTMGGAESVDKYRRLNGISWWQQEIPNHQEMNEGLDNLKLYNNKIDYILTHDIPSSYKEELLKIGAIKDIMSNGLDRYLQEIYNITNFEHWYAGHFHIDDTWSNITILYKKLIKIGDKYDAKF